MNDVKASVFIPQNCPSAVCDPPGGGVRAASRRLAEGDRVLQDPHSTLERDAPHAPGRLPRLRNGWTPPGWAPQSRARASGTPAA